MDGFRGGAEGYAHVDGPLAVPARKVGVYGIAAVAAALAMLLAQLRRSDLYRPRAWALVVTVAIALAGLSWQRQQAIATPNPAATAPLTLALLQGISAGREISVWQRHPDGLAVVIKD